MSFRCVVAWFFHLIMVITMVFSAAMIIVGYLNAVVQVHDVTVSNFFRILGIILIVVGVAALILGLIGLLASCFPSKCLLTSFSALMAIFLIGQFTAIITAFSYYDEKTLANELKTSVQFYHKDKDIKTFWDVINTKLECCGIESVKDWKDDIPNSCCKDLNINDVCHKEHANEKPCILEIVPIITRKLPVGLTFLGMTQIICLVASVFIPHSENETD